MDKQLSSKTKTQSYEGDWFVLEYIVRPYGKSFYQVIDKDSGNAISKGEIKEISGLGLAKKGLWYETE